MKFAIINVKDLIKVVEVRTIEEAYHMLEKWKKYAPNNEFEIMEIR